MDRLLRILLLCLLPACIAPSAAAREADSLSRRASLPAEEQFHWHKLIAPGLLATGGALGVASPWYASRINEPIRDYAAQLRGDRYLRFDDYIQYVPSAAYLGLGFAVESRHDFRERALVACTAWATTALITLPTKNLVGELRPDGSSRNSFPSGHSATAFVGAELVRLEYGPWWGAGAYTVATLTAVMRVYNNRHWFNDVLAGAAVGILSANAAYWLLPLERRLFSLEGKDTAMLAVPYCSTQGAGMSFALVF